VSARKRFSSGLLFDFNYTYGRSIDMSSTRETDGITSGQIVNPWSPRQMRAVSDYDTTHIFTAFFVYELPFGKGKPILGSNSKLLNAIVGGWQWNGIYRQTSGFPICVGNGGFWPTNWNISGCATQLSPLTASTVRNANVKNGGPYNVRQSGDGPEGIRLHAARAVRIPEHTAWRWHLQTSTRASASASPCRTTNATPCRSGRRSSTSPIPRPSM
jgi:hypothetical protein